MSLLRMIEQFENQVLGSLYQSRLGQIENCQFFLIITSTFK